MGLLKFLMYIVQVYFYLISIKAFVSPEVNPMLKILYPTKNNNNKTNAYFVLVLSEENIFILFVTLYLHGRS